jgi:hypothetical protein
MPGQEDRAVLTRNFDLEGNGAGRILRHWIRMKTAIMGNYDTGPGLRCLLTLWLLHRVGRPLFALRTRLTNQYALKARIRGLVRRLRR